jgi:hypothetical protein
MVTPLRLIKEDSISTQKPLHVLYQGFAVRYRAILVKIRPENKIGHNRNTTREASV